MRLFAFLVLSLLSLPAFTRNHYTVDTFIEAAADENFEEALKQAEELLKTNPNNNFIRLEQSRLYLEVGKVVEARKAFEQVDRKKTQLQKEYDLYGWKIFNQSSMISDAAQKNEYIQKAKKHLSGLFEYNSIWNHKLIKEVEGFLSKNADPGLEKAFKEKKKIVRE